MTLARSLLQPFHFHVSDELFPTAEKPLVAMRYPVSLHKIGGEWNDFKIGHVVTHLSLEDWCLMKGYRLVANFQGACPAMPDERTDLF
jgi:hypothetical protein